MKMENDKLSQNTVRYFFLLSILLVVIFDFFLFFIFYFFRSNSYYFFFFWKSFLLLFVCFLFILACFISSYLSNVLTEGIYSIDCFRFFGSFFFWPNKYPKARKFTLMTKQICVDFVANGIDPSGSLHFIKKTLYTERNPEILLHGRAWS